MDPLALCPASLRPATEGGEKSALLPRLFQRGYPAGEKSPPGDGRRGIALRSRQRLPMQEVRMRLPFQRRSENVAERLRSTLHGMAKALEARRRLGRTVQGWAQTARWRVGKRLPVALPRLELPSVRGLPEVTIPTLPRRRRRLPDRYWLMFATGIGTGALLMFLADPQTGQRRRQLVADQVGRFQRLITRDIPQWMQGRVVWLGGRLRGLIDELGIGRSGGQQYDDAALADKVRSELGLAHEINVHVENGVVVLRGTLTDREQAEDLARRVQRIAGVKGVENLITVA